MLFSRPSRGSSEVCDKTSTKFNNDTVIPTEASGSVHNRSVMRRDSTISSSCPRTMTLAFLVAFLLVVVRVDAFVVRPSTPLLDTCLSAPTCVVGSTMSCRHNNLLVRLEAFRNSRGSRSSSRSSTTRRERRLVAKRKQLKKARFRERQQQDTNQTEAQSHAKNVDAQSQLTSASSPSEEGDAWNASTTTTTTANTFGSLLLKLQKEEEEEMRKMANSRNKDWNATTALEDQIRMARPETNSNNLTATNKSTSVVTVIPPPETVSPMDREAVRELDDAVTGTSRDTLLEGMQVLDKSPLDYSMRTSRSKQNMGHLDLLQLQRMPLSMPEHYSDRIGRDMRHLAVSIASCTDEVWQWRLFCREKGGIIPLLQCIRDGVAGLESYDMKGKGRHDRQRSEDLLLESSAREEDFLVACTACRSLRDLCALSPEMAAIMTDGFLRVNQAWMSPTLKQGYSNESGSNSKRRHRQSHRKMDLGDLQAPHRGPISDLVALLQNANELELPHEARGFFRMSDRRNRRDARRRSKLYVLQLLLAMAVASDDAIHAFRSTPGLVDAVLASSSYARKERTRRWLRYPVEVAKRWVRVSKKEGDAAQSERALRSRPFIEAASLGDDLQGKVQGTANQLLAAIGCNRWIPKIPGQKGLRILCIDGGGSRGMAAVTSLNCLVKAMGNAEACDTFDMIVGTSTGAIIAFLVGLRRESSGQARERYNILIRKIFVKSALSTPLMLFTTATYDEAPFMDILKEILGDSSMLDSRSDPAVPLVFAVSSKMSSTPTHVSLFRNYNYAGGELRDPFTIDPGQARDELDLPLGIEHETLRSSSVATREEAKQFSPGARLSQDASRHPGSFRVLQKHALRASTAAPTVFKPVFMGGEVYCDGGIVASNPAAVAIHEARTLFPDVPIELVVSIGTGGFTEEKSAPRIGWDGIIGQIVNSATDGEQIHHILEDILGGEGMENLGKASVSTTKYYRLNPVIGGPNDFPIDVTDPKLLRRLSEIAEAYFEEPEQKRKLKEINEILEGRRGWRKLLQA